MIIDNLKKLFQYVPEPYCVRFDMFYEDKPEICKDEINQLSKRYGIFGKKILSIGAGSAHEEYWFIEKQENNLTIIDIDEHAALESRLKRLNCKDEEVDHKTITYYIGNFLRFRKDDFINQFDLLYYSSFTPDELRRGQIMSRANGLKGSLKDQNLNWFLNEKPLHSVIEKSLKFIKSNGLFVLQSYCSGIDLKNNPSYLVNLIKQLNDHGINLIDIYCLEEAPAVNLFVGYKGDKEETRLFYSKISNNEINKFHGRAQLNNKARKIFSYGYDRII